MQTATTKPGDKYRSLQRPDVYKALRRRGHTKQAAARISNAQAPGHTVKAESEPGQLCPYCTADLALPDSGWYECGHCGKPFYAADTDSDYEDYHCFRADRLRNGMPPQPATMPTARVLKPPRKEYTTKDANWSAKRGETIQGGLKRGNDGKFSSAGGSSAPAPKPTKGRKPNAAKPKKAAAVKLTPEQRKQQRETEAANKRLANWEATAAAQTRLAKNEFDDMVDFAEGANEKPASADALIAKGVLERGRDGSLRLTEAGRVATNAANRGDARAVNDALSRAGDRKVQGDERAATARQRANERAARQAERDRKKQEREAKKLQPKPKGGGGGGKKGDDKDAQAQAKLDQSIAELQRLAGKAATPSSFTVFKDTNGAWRWLAQTTTAYEDRDREVISLKSLEADALRMDADGKYGPLRWWHIGSPNALDAVAPWGPGLDLGWCDFNAVSGKTLIESGTFKTEAIARWAAANADALGLSPGFFHPPSEPDRDGVFHHIRRFERSVAPVGRVSNLFTAFAVTRNHTHKEYTPVDPAKISQLLDMGFDQATLKALLANVTQTEKTAEAAGVRFKETAPTNPALERIAAMEQELATLKAAAMRPIEEEKAPVDDSETQLQAADDIAEDVMTDDGDAASDQAFFDALGALLDAKLAPVVAALGVHDRMEKMVGSLQGELKAMAGGSSTATKTAQVIQTELATLKARIAEIEGGATNLQRGFIASQADGTVTKTAAALAVESQPQPLSEVEDAISWARQEIPRSLLGSLPSAS